MRLFRSIRRRPVLWACLSLVLIGVVIAYPTFSRTTRMFFAERALGERNAEAALGWLESIPQRNRVGQTHLLFAKAYRRQGKLDLVREHLFTAWDLGVEVERLEREQWLSLAQSGQMREAESHLRQLLQNPGEDAHEICEAFVAGYLRNYNFSKAAPMLAAWEADFPRDPRPHEMQGVWFQAAGRWREAAISYEKALTLDPKKTHIRRDLAISLREIHEYEKAKTHFLQCLSETPDDTLLLIEWGELLLSTGSASEAKSILQKVLNADPADENARFAMARTLLKDGDTGAALELLQQLHKESPLDSRIKYSLALALEASGKVEQAAEMFKQVTEAQEKLRRKQELTDSLNQDSSQPEVRYEIALIAMNHEDPSEGVRWLLSVLDLEPGHIGAHRELADFYQRVGNVELEQKHRALAKLFAESTSE